MGWGWCEGWRVPVIVSFKVTFCPKAKQIKGGNFHVRVLLCQCCWTSRHKKRISAWIPYWSVAVEITAGKSVNRQCEGWLWATQMWMNESWTLSKTYNKDRRVWRWTFVVHTNKLHTTKTFTLFSDESYVTNLFFVWLIVLPIHTIWGLTWLLCLLEILLHCHCYCQRLSFFFFFFVTKISAQSNGSLSKNYLHRLHRPIWIY